MMLPEVSETSKVTEMQCMKIFKVIVKKCKCLKTVTDHFRTLF